MNGEMGEEGDNQHHHHNHHEEDDGMAVGDDMGDNEEMYHQ